MACRRVLSSTPLLVRPSHREGHKSTVSAQYRDNFYSTEVGQPMLFNCIILRTSQFLMFVTEGNMSFILLYHL
jgi:hypothetical protein